MKEPRELTTAEVRKNFLRHLKKVAVYWDKVEGRTTLEKIEGAIFSTLVTLDGAADCLPAFIVAPYPHESDRDFDKNNGENWYPQNNSKVNCDIAGSLHHEFSKLNHNKRRLSCQK